MKDSSTSTSRSASVRLGSDQGSSSTAATESSMPSPASSGGGASKTCFKDPMFSSSDTDDCDADKLVIDLDATGSTENSSCDAKQVIASVACIVLPPASGSTTAVAARADPIKIRPGEHIGAKSSGISHRQSLSGGKSASNQQHTDGGLQPAHPPTEKGLKMKIKCSQIGGAGGPARHEISQFHTLVNSSSGSSASSAGSSNTTLSASGGVKSTSGGGVVVDKDKEVHVKIDRLAHRKDTNKTNVKERTVVKDRPLPDTSSSVSSLQATSTSLPIAAVVTACANSTTLKEVSPSNDVTVKSPMEIDTEVVTTQQKDPYEFNVKTEESVVGRPTKKIKLDKFDAACSPLVTNSSSSPSGTRDVSVDACHVGVLTDPDCLGPCEPGTTVTLEGIVWNETENGLLVVNVTWRGKTYVGTLMDATRHHWAPPRFATDSPTSDLDGRTPKGRGKRGRTCTNRLEINGSDRKLRSNRCAAAAAAAVKSGLSSAGSTSPVRSESGPSGPAIKRPRGSESQTGSGSSCSDISRGGVAPTKMTANRAESRTSVTPADIENNSIEGALIECPAPKCNKKYRHINGLRYHQSRSHPNMNFDDDAEDMDEKLSASNSKVKNYPDGIDMESASDVDRNDAIEASTANVLQTNDLSSKHDKKSKSDRSKAKSAMKQTVDSQDTPSSPSVNVGKPFVDDASLDKQKYRKKDRERVKDAAGFDQADSTAEDNAVKNHPLSSGRVTQGVSTNELSSVNAETSGQQPVEEVAQLKRERCSETVSVIRTAGEINSASSSLSNGEMHSSSFQVSLETTSVVENEVPLVKCEAGASGIISSSSALAVDRSAPSPSPTLPLKRTKITPTKYGPDFDNPHSPAYSDISDANDSAPMLEKEATPSAADDDLTVNGCSVVERGPVLQRSADNFIGSYNGSAASSSLYGQPPCLTPAVIPVPTLDGTQHHPVAVKIEKIEPSANNLDDRPGHSIDSRTNPLRPSRIPGDAVRPSGPEISEPVERNLGPLQRSVSRSHGGDAPSPQAQQQGAAMMHPNLFMQYPYAAAQGGYPPLELLQQQEYRAQFERLVQQGMMRRPDQLPASSLSKPPVDFPPDFKGFPGPIKPSESDRKNSKNDNQLPPGGLPTPPSLIPDRSMLSYDDADSRVMKQKNLDRRDDAPRSAYPPHQQYVAGGGGDHRQRRHDAPSSKESNSIKPSAVVAPQARDRSTKIRPEDQSRSGHKPSIKSGTHQDAMSSRPPKDVSSDRSNRDEKSSVVGRSGSTSASYKKEEPRMSSPITSVSLPLPTSYPPFYPYLSTQFDPTAFYGGLNPMIGYGNGPQGPFLHPAQVGYLPQPTNADVGAMMSPAGPNLSPSDGKSRDGVAPRGFYPGGDGLGVGTPSSMHKIHELKDVAKGVSGLSGDNSQSSGSVSTSSSALRDVVRPESRGSAVGGGLVGLTKELDRAGTASPPTQRHVHTHHHMHMLGPAIPPLFGSVFPSDPSMMASSQAGPTTSNCPPLSRPFIGK